MFRLSVFLQTTYSLWRCVCVNKGHRIKLWLLQYTVIDNNKVIIPITPQKYYFFLDLATSYKIFTNGKAAFTSIFTLSEKNLSNYS